MHDTEVVGYLPGISWKRVLLYGVAAEVLVVLLVSVSYLALGRGDVIPLSFAGTLLFGYLAARKSESRLVVHGFLVGLTAVAIYLATGAIGRAVMSLANITLPQSNSQPPPYLYQVAHVFKLLGGIAGGYLAGRRRTGTA